LLFDLVGTGGLLVPSEALLGNGMVLATIGNTTFLSVLVIESLQLTGGASSDGSALSGSVNKAFILFLWHA